jgi:hypothetical protein
MESGRAHRANAIIMYPNVTSVLVLKSYYRHRKPRARALATASVRLLADNLARMLLT